MVLCPRMMVQCPNAPGNAKNAKTYSTNAENNQNGVRIGSCLCCLFATPKSRSMVPYARQLSAAKNQLIAVERSNLLFHEERNIALMVAEITSKHKYKGVMGTPYPKVKDSLAALHQTGLFTFAYGTNRHFFCLSNSLTRNHRVERGRCIRSGSF